MSESADASRSTLESGVIARFEALGIAPLLAEIIACPCEHHSPVSPDVEKSALICDRCATSFPVQDGVPVMLIDDATPGPKGIGIAVSEA